MPASGPQLGPLRVQGRGHAGLGVPGWLMRPSGAAARRPGARAAAAQAHSTAKPAHGGEREVAVDRRVGGGDLRVLRDALLDGERGGRGDPQHPLRRRRRGRTATVARMYGSTIADDHER